MLCKFREISAKSIISKSNLPGSDFAINPYVGCTHSCIYCYARFMQKFTDHKEAWGRFLDIKTNAGELVSEKNASKTTGKMICFSSVTDPYQPAEKKYRLMPQILKKLQPFTPKISILTKSWLVINDIELLKAFSSCEIGMSISTLDDELRKEIEPFAARVKDRISALRELKKHGLHTYVFIGPLFPIFTDWKAIIEATAEFTDYYIFENLNIKGTIWHDIKRWLSRKHPSALPEYEKIYFREHNIYWKEIKQEISHFCNAKQIQHQIFFHHQ
jgi:DNA repair photolyase